MIAADISRPDVADEAETSSDREILKFGQSDSKLGGGRRTNTGADE